MKIAIIDYGAGNLRSVAKAVERVGFEPRVTSDPADACAADAVILPGVGAAEDTMRNLGEHGLVEPVQQIVAGGTPFLGVCMGMQALLTVSEEGGEHACLDIIAGRVRRLPAGVKVPHMGWNTVRQVREHAIFEGIDDGEYFYFVHSYYVDPEDAAVIAGETEYGVSFPSVLVRGNLVATQFHPEKSGEAGLRIYANFLRAAREANRGAAPVPLG
ncbi:MAG TPA: imidazole glycerol phosphate synthase subunit HisH [Dehalococcoidia bacterium]|nr:imidazole glycerol phosphate synthase subunit HisH [Dehalococcoidia bacterium]